MKTILLRSSLFAVLVTLAFTVIAKEAVQSKVNSVEPVYSDRYLMQEPFSSGELLFYSSLEASPDELKL